MLKLCSLVSALLLVSGCASYGVVDNEPQTVTFVTAGYSIQSGGGSGWGSGDIALILAFSGGGTRAAALVQDYFNLLCSDISDYPVARAVTASSAVPVLFNPVVVKNYQECKKAKPAWLLAAEKRANGDPELALAIGGLNSYFKKDRRQYAHFVDGGITDNLGLRAIYEIIEISGGSKAFFEGKLKHKPPPPRLVIISVNASTDVW